MNSARRYLILTTFARADVVAAVLHLHGAHVAVVPLESGVVVVHDLPVPTFDDWDISELVGGPAPENDAADRENDAADTETSLADQPEKVAALLSELSSYGVVLMIGELGDDVGGEAGTSGIISAVRYLDGQRGEDLPSGLVLNMVDPQVEGMLLGHLEPADIPGVITELSAEQLAELIKVLSPDAGDEPESGDERA